MPIVRGGSGGLREKLLCRLNEWCHFCGSRVAVVDVFCDRTGTATPVDHWECWRTRIMKDRICCYCSAKFSGLGSEQGPLGL